MKDQYGREITYLRVSLTDLCNLRCLYCMPAEGVPKLAHSDILSQEELLCAIGAAASLGIHRVRFTGGEPLIKKNVISVCERTSRIEGIREVSLTTNATLLSEKAAALREAGVSRINISLDTLDPEKYARITRGGCLRDALCGLRSALDAGFEKIRINTVLLKGFNEDEIRRMAELTLRYPLDVRFIERMPVGSCGIEPSGFLRADCVLEELAKLVPADQSRAPLSSPDTAAPAAGDDAGPAEYFTLPGALGNVGLIRPISRPFCGSCSRIRLTADGKIRPCLHAAQEYSVKGLSPEGMRDQIQRAIQNKCAGHTLTEETVHGCGKRTMNQIGG